MKIEDEGQLLRIFVGEGDCWEGRPLYEMIVRAAREQGLAGATALRGIEGFGASNRIHTVKILRLSEDLPIVIEIVDRRERIAKFLPTIDRMVAEGLVTLENVSVVIYRHDHAGEQPETAEIPLETQDAERTAASAGGPFQSTDRARETLDDAKRAAANSRRVFVDSVDVLLAMLREQDGTVRRVLADLSVDVEAVERALREAVNRDEPSDEFIIALELKSLGAAKWLGHDHVGIEHLLLALCEVRPNAATDILMRLGASPREICRKMVAILGHQDDWQRWLADHPDM